MCESCAPSSTLTFLICIKHFFQLYLQLFVRNNVESFDKLFSLFGICIILLFSKVRCLKMTVYLSKETVCCAFYRNMVEFKAIKLSCHRLKSQFVLFLSFHFNIMIVTVIVKRKKLMIKQSSHGYLIILLDLLINLVSCLFCFLTAIFYMYM